jgi:hypothetical protein
MSRHQSLIVTAGLLLALLPMAPGCGHEAGPTVASPQQETQSFDLNAANGGLTSTDEAPAFNDETLLRMAEEASATTELGTDPFIIGNEQPPATRVYAMSVVWGALPTDGIREPTNPNGDDGDVYDWSGGMTLSRGALRLAGVIAFERSDSIILPRTDPRSLAWISHTDAAFDGVRVLLFQPPQPDSTIKDTLVFRAGSYERSFLLSELANLDEMVGPDGNGNSLRFRSAMIDPEVSNQGPLRGRWRSIALGDSVGPIDGIWIGQHGRVLGFFRGVYGENAQKERVLFAKVTNLRGAFRGILRGTWGKDQLNSEGGQADQASSGWFRSRWIVEGEQVGAAGGHWATRRDRPGFLTGRWCMECDSLDTGTQGIAQSTVRF